MSGKILLLSLQPQFAEKVFDGTKKVELRRTWPKVTIDTVLVYVSTPVKALVGAFTVAQIMEGNPTYLWGKVRRHAGITRKQFDDYYAGALKGYGIFFSDIKTLPSPVELSQLRELWTDFHPPQSYRYMDAKAVERLELLSLTSSSKIIKGALRNSARQTI